VTAAVDPVPARQHGATPYLCVQGAAAALDFYAAAFGAVETMRLVDPNDGRIGHAWHLASLRESLSDAEMHRRFAALYGK
jgi:uncharacterized glyoxalase superfamily protein PhnB